MITIRTQRFRPACRQTESKGETRRLGPAAVGPARAAGGEVQVLTETHAVPAGETDAAPAARHPRNGRFTAMLVSGALTLVLALLALALPVPYVVEAPGPTFNTVGQDEGKPVIQVQGHDTYDSQGALDLVTVYVTGGPNSNVSVFGAFQAWLNKRDSVIPVELLYPPGTSPQQVESQNVAAMTGSQENATAAALTTLGISYDSALSVAALPDGSASAGKLEPNDVLRTINGEPVTDITVIQKALAASNGDAVDVGFQRAGKDQTEQITPQRGSDGRYLLGIQLAASYTFPFNVSIALTNVVGPSAGMMFALGLIDRLTPGDLTGGKHFAGTGTIDPQGNVGAIGGIAQKMIGAREGGASVFLAPAANCNDVVGHIPDGLQVVKVETLDQAQSAVRQIGSGADGSTLPTCTAG
jgi:PDZ domain-containing protein